MMKLKKLYIHRGYNADAPLRAELEFISEAGDEIKTRLDEALSREVVRLCAEAIAQAGQRAADALSAEALRQTAIEHKPGDD